MIYSNDERRTQAYSPAWNIYIRTRCTKLSVTYSSKMIMTSENSLLVQSFSLSYWTFPVESESRTICQCRCYIIGAPQIWHFVSRYVNKSLFVRYISSANTGVFDFSEKWCLYIISEIRSESGTLPSTPQKNKWILLCVFESIKNDLTIR